MRSGTGKIIVSSPLIEISALGWQHDLCPADISPKSWFVSREIFIFKILERVHSLTEAVLGENIDFFAQNSRISHFQSGHLPDNASVNWAAYETRLPDYLSGPVLNDFD